MNYIISIAAGQGQVRLIKEIKAAGYGVIACDLNPDAEGFKYSDIVINQSTYAADKIYEELKTLNNCKIDGIKKSLLVHLIITNISRNYF